VQVNTAFFEGKNFRVELLAAFRHNLNKRRDLGMMILFGTTTAGKTSIINHLSTSQEGRFAVVSFDDYFFASLLHEIGGNQAPSQWSKAMISTISKITIDTAFQQAHRKVCEMAKKAHATGKIVLIDTCIIDKASAEIYQQSLADMNLQWIVVFCPPKELVHRVERRNQDSPPDEHRSAHWALKQFYESYEVCNEGNLMIDQTGLNSICTCPETMDLLMDGIAEDWLKAIRKAYCPYGIAQIQQYFDDKFVNATSNPSLEKLHIRHFQGSDFQVDTSRMTTLECAEKIMEFMKGAFPSMSK
jgi:chloramphenicol 3-O-phosphotransferase